MVFEIWDIESGNLLGSYDSEEEALAVVHDALNRHGREYVEALALVREGPSRIVHLREFATSRLALSVPEESVPHSETIAAGKQLADLAATSSAFR